ncbi:uncharacterized protein PG998_008748 [Apiospora kogelbergensis]|uniref:uncharacterized protein n=1 Tax=Apiospora kogelbergensis TaxID=1337665 RepID=UPI0031326954
MRTGCMSLFWTTIAPNVSREANRLDFNARQLGSMISTLLNREVRHESIAISDSFCCLNPRTGKGSCVCDRCAPMQRKHDDPENKLAPSLKAHNPASKMAATEALRARQTRSAAASLVVLPSSWPACGNGWAVDQYDLTDCACFHPTIPHRKEAMALVWRIYIKASLVIGLLWSACLQGEFRSHPQAPLSPKRTATSSAGGVADTYVRSKDRHPEQPPGSMKDCPGAGIPSSSVGLKQAKGSYAWMPPSGS